MKMPLERIYRYMNNMTSWQKYALTLPVKYNTFSDNQLVIYQASGAGHVENISGPQVFFSLWSE